MMGERGFLVELVEACLEAVTKRAHGRGLEERVEGFDVRVDGQNLDAIRAQKPRERGEREVRSRRIARGRVNEGNAHGRACLAHGEKLARSARILPTFGDFR